MTTMKKLLATAAIAGLILGGSGYAFAETADQPAHHEKHKHHLTDEQKQALKDAGVDLKQLREGHKELRDAFRSLHEKGEKLKATADSTNNKELQKQLHADIKSIHAQLKQVKELHKANKQYRQDFRAAVDAKDTAKIKDAYEKMMAAHKQELELVTKANDALDADLKKVQQ